MNTNVSLETGDIIGVAKFGYRHVGVYAGPRFDRRDVVHNNKFGGVVLSSFAEFSGGSPVYIQQKASGDYFDREIIKQRALSLLGKKYDLLLFNCEHAATFAQSGQAKSPQLQGFALLGLLFVGLAVLARD